MYTDDCIAMVLAGGRGERLGALTRYYAKPAVHFGRNNRIIDFTLHNCMCSKIDTIGILTQYLSDDLHAYVSSAYNSLHERDHLYLLPPKSDECSYVATADAIYKNIEFIDLYQPEDVLILAGDHIYSMDYNQLIAFHKETGAEVTVASTPVPLNEACQYGILNAYKDGRVYGFEEKPCRPKTNLASMGIYVFKWSALRTYLLADSEIVNSHHDFGQDIIPGMLSSNELVFTYKFDGYWRDVGTLSGLWEANMDLIANSCELSTLKGDTDSSKKESDRKIISEDCMVLGKVRHSVLSKSVTVDAGAEVVDSVIMPGAYIGKNVKIYKTIVGTGAQILNNSEVGVNEGISAYVDRQMCKGDISLVAPWAIVPEGMRFQQSSQIHGVRTEKLQGCFKTIETANYSTAIPGLLIT